MDWFYLEFGVQRLEGLQRQKQVGINCRTMVSQVRPWLIGWYSECVYQWVHPWWALSLADFPKQRTDTDYLTPKFVFTVIGQVNRFKADSDSCLFPWLQTTLSFSKRVGTFLFSTRFTVEAPPDFQLHENGNMISIAHLNTPQELEMTGIELALNKCW